MTIDYFFLLVRTLRNYKASQLFYKFYYDIIKNNEIYKKKFTSLEDTPSPNTVKLFQFIINNDAKIKITNGDVNLTVLNEKVECSIDDLWDAGASDLINFQINYLTYLSSSIPFKDKIYLLDQHIEYSKENSNHYIYDPFVISIKLVQIIKFISAFSIKNRLYDR